MRPLKYLPVLYLLNKKGEAGCFWGAKHPKNTPHPELLRRYPVFVFVGLIALYLAGCAGQRPVLVGLSAELTGRRGELGVAARNGAEMAVEKINAEGGINGRPIELIVKNDQGDPKIARQVDQELAEMGVVAIVGHITSEQTAASFKQNNDAGIVMISPTSSSSDFTGKKDYFFRVMPSNQFMGTSLARYIHDERGITQLYGIYDMSNQSFTETFWQATQAEFARLGGDASQSTQFVSGTTDLKALIADVNQQHPQAILFIASAVDTALMLQYSQQAGMQAQFFSSTWAQTQELIEKGGQAVEGLEMSGVYDSNHASQAYQQFKRDYEARYGAPPILGASHTYEAILVLAEALKRTDGQAEGLPEAFATVKDFSGLQGMISLDAYGDVEREMYIIQVDDGVFQVIDTVEYK